MTAGDPAAAATERDLELECRYETLRSDVVAGTGQGWRWGRALLQRQGMAAWIRAWTDLPTGVATVPVSPAPVAVAPGSEQLVAVLAAMTLAVTTAGGGRG